MGCGQSKEPPPKYNPLKTSGTSGKTGKPHHKAHIKDSVDFDELTECDIEQLQAELNMRKQVEEELTRQLYEEKEQLRKVAEQMIAKRLSCESLLDELDAEQTQLVLSSEFASFKHQNQLMRRILKARQERNWSQGITVPWRIYNNIEAISEPNMVHLALFMQKVLNVLPSLHQLYGVAPISPPRGTDCDAANVTDEVSSVGVFTTQPSLPRIAEGFSEVQSASEKIDGFVGGISAADESQKSGISMDSSIGSSRTAGIPRDSEWNRVGGLPIGATTPLMELNARHGLSADDSVHAGIARQHSSSSSSRSNSLPTPGSPALNTHPNFAAGMPYLHTALATSTKSREADEGEGMFFSHESKSKSLDSIDSNSTGGGGAADGSGFSAAAGLGIADSEAPILTGDSEELLRVRYELFENIQELKYSNEEEEGEAPLTPSTQPSATTETAGTAGTAGTLQSNRSRHSMHSLPTNTRSSSHHLGGHLSLSPEVIEMHRKELLALPVYSMAPRSFFNITQDNIYDYELPPGCVTMEVVRIIIDLFKKGGRLTPKSVHKLLRLGYKSLQAKANTTYINLDPGDKLTVVGDLHGQLGDLLHIVDAMGMPGRTNRYVFNGDFVDRGSNGVEVMCTLLALHVAQPDYVILNRGNHEDFAICTVYGFQQECSDKYGDVIFGLFVEVFQQIPLFAIVNQDVFILHGGLFHTRDIRLTELDAINRQAFSLQDLPENGEGLEPVPRENAVDFLKQLVRDALWSDPVSNEGIFDSVRGAGVSFGPDVAKDFLHTNGLKFIVRSHECVRSGYDEPFTDEDSHLLCTIFSASDYGGSGNCAAYLVFTLPAPAVAPPTESAGKESSVSFSENGSNGSNGKIGTIAEEDEEDAADEDEETIRAAKAAAKAVDTEKADSQNGHSTASDVGANGNATKGRKLKKKVTMQLDDVQVAETAAPPPASSTANGSPKRKKTRRVLSKRMRNMSITSTVKQSLEQAEQGHIVDNCSDVKLISGSEITYTVHYYFTAPQFNTEDPVFNSGSFAGDEHRHDNASFDLAGLVDSSLAAAGVELSTSDSIDGSAKHHDALASSYSIDCRTFSHSTSNFSMSPPPGAYAANVTVAVAAGNGVDRDTLIRRHRSKYRRDADSILIGSPLTLYEFIAHRKYDLLRAFETKDTRRDGVLSKSQWAEVMREGINIHIRWMSLMQLLVLDKHFKMFHGKKMIDYIAFLEAFHEEGDDDDNNEQEDDGIQGQSEEQQNEGVKPLHLSLRCVDVDGTDGDGNNNNADDDDIGFPISSDADDPHEGDVQALTTTLPRTPLAAERRSSEEDTTDTTTTTRGQGNALTPTPSTATDAPATTPATHATAADSGATENGLEVMEGGSDRTQYSAAVELRNYCGFEISESLMEILYINYPQVESAFRYFDRNEDGFITKDEFREACKEINLFLPPKLKIRDIEGILMLMDVEETGEIPFNIFFELYRLSEMKLNVGIDEEDTLANPMLHSDTKDIRRSNSTASALHAAALSSKLKHLEIHGVEINIDNELNIANTTGSTPQYNLQLAIQRDGAGTAAAATTTTTTTTTTAAAAATARGGREHNIAGIAYSDSHQPQHQQALPPPPPATDQKATVDV